MYNFIIYKEDSKLLILVLESTEKVSSTPILWLWLDWRPVVMSIEMLVLMFDRKTNTGLVLVGARPVIILLVSPVQVNTTHGQQAPYPRRTVISNWI